MKYQRNLLPDTDELVSTRGDGARWLTPAHLVAAAHLGRRLRGNAVRQAIARICWPAGRSLGVLVGWLAIWRSRVRGRRHLALMDERQLRDIGLSRLDAKREINKPFWRE